MDSINTEAVYYSAGYTTKSGWKITLALPDEDAAKALDAIGAGKRYMLAMVPIADDETPDTQAMQKAQKANNCTTEKPKKKLTLAQRAGILCNDKRFFGVYRRMQYGSSRSFCARILWY